MMQQQQRQQQQHQHLSLRRCVEAPEHKSRPVWPDWAIFTQVLLGNKLFHKIARIFWWHFGLFLIMSLWCKKCVATVWAFFISSSGHTWHLKVNNVPTYLPTWLLDHLFFLLLAQDIYTQVGTNPYFLSLSFYQANTLSMELFSSRRWRLYRPKQKAVVFMLNLKTFYNKHVALFHRCLTVGSILLVNSSMHYLSLSRK